MRKTSPGQIGFENAISVSKKWEKWDLKQYNFSWCGFKRTFFVFYQLVRVYLTSKIKAIKIFHVGLESNSMIHDSSFFSTHGNAIDWRDMIAYFHNIWENLFNGLKWRHAYTKSANPHSYSKGKVAKPSEKNYFQLWEGTRSKIVENSHFLQRIWLKCFGLLPGLTKFCLISRSFKGRQF